MKFLKITPVRRYRIFRNFTWPATLPEFTRYNVIYGWNGSGKTTLSSAYRALERRQDLASGECEFFFQGGSIKGNQLSSDRPRPAVWVFNRGYVDETVFRPGLPGVPSIFYVAEGSKDKQGRIDGISTLLRGPDGKSGLAGKISAALGNEQRANKAFDDFQISKAAATKAELRSSDSSRFNNYNKSDFRSGIDRLLAKGDQAVKAAKLDERGLKEARQKKDVKRQPAL
ncbi:AAA family ATPase [Lysobacter enzymogenes]|uniref:AAA family ATPase n=1 Tax=Lysobacter enzymogenes TaxID=69 RepID=UPI00384ABC65